MSLERGLTFRQLKELNSQASQEALRARLAISEGRAIICVHPFFGRIPGNSEGITDGIDYLEHTKRLRKLANKASQLRAPLIVFIEEYGLSDDAEFQLTQALGNMQKKSEVFLVKTFPSTPMPSRNYGCFLDTCSDVRGGVIGMDSNWNDLMKIFKATGLKNAYLAGERLFLEDKTNNRLGCVGRLAKVLEEVNIDTHFTRYTYPVSRRSRTWKLQKTRREANAP